MTQNSAVITWTASSDNTKVAGYNVFVDGGKKNINLVTDTQYALSGLIADTVYTVEVQAVDEAGNTSGNAKAEFKTEKDPFAPTPDIVNKNDLKINIEAAEKLLAMADKYTEESLTALKSAYGAASEVYNDKDAKQAHVDEKNTALLNAIKDLDEKKTMTRVTEVKTMAAPTMEKVTTAKMMEKTTVRITDRRERSLTVGRTTGRQIPEMVLRPKKPAKTGDVSNLALYGLALVASAGAAGAGSETQKTAFVIIMTQKTIFDIITE